MPIFRTSMASVIALGLVTLVPTASFAKRHAVAIKTIDPDNDGLLSLAEAEAAAMKVFAAMDPDNDGLIDKKEAKGPLKRALKADPDKDGAIGKDEFKTLVDAAFKAADPDGDGQLDAKELKSPAGKHLLKLIK